MRSQLIDMPARATAPRRRRLRQAIAGFATASLLVSGLAAGVATSAQAAPLPVRGDSDSVQGLVTAVTSSHPNTSSGNENINSLKDRNPATKWYASGAGEPSTGSPQWAIYTLSNAATVTGYGITSAADSAKFPQRDPAAWTVLGSNDAAAASDANHSSWQQIDSRSGQVFAVDNLSRVYAASAPGSYRYFQLRVTAKAASGSNLQIADWTLRSGEAGFSNAIISPDTTWEYLNDPTGAIDPAPGEDLTAWTQVGADLPGTWTDALGPFGAKRGSSNLGSGFPVTTTLPLDRGGTTDNVVPSYFFRTTFELDQAALNSINGLYGTLIHDDAVAMFINGKNVFTDFEGDSRGALTTNLDYRGGTLTDPRSKQLLIPATDLRVGENVISVQLHNVNATSSDVYFYMPSLSATSDNVPVPFTPEEINASYSSDIQPRGKDHPDFFIDQLLNFEELANTRPDVISPRDVNVPWSGGSEIPRVSGLTSMNDKVTVTINNVAAAQGMDHEKIVQARKDDAETTVQLTTAYGDVLGTMLADAINGGEVPKTAWLIKRVEQGRNHEPAKAYYAYKRPFNRLGFVNPVNNPCDSGSGELGGTFSGPGRIENTKNPGHTGQGAGYGLCNNGSLPSGHTNHGFAQGTTYATLLPELSAQMMYRSSEYANSRIILGYHYALDVMTGRLAGNATAAQRWDDPAFVNLLEQAQEELQDVLGDKCQAQAGTRDLRDCAFSGNGILSDEEALQIYRERMTYETYLTADGQRQTNGFERIYDEAKDLPVNMPNEAPAILKTFFPDLSHDERAAVLRATAIEGGWAFDRTKDGSDSWQRLDFAAAMNADVSRATNGDLIVNGVNASDSTLSSITLDGIALPGFTSGSHEYTVDRTEQGGVLPEIEVTATVPGVSVNVELPDAAPGEAVITVTSLDGQTTEYTINLTVASAVATLQSLTVNGASVPGFNPDVHSYVVELPTGTTTAPVVAAVPTVTGADVQIEQATGPNGTATVTVKAANGSTTTYVIDFTVKPAPGGGDTPGGKPVTAAVSATVQGVTYNKAAKVTVSVQAAGNVPTGRVLVTKGAQSLGSATLSAGSAVVTLPRDLAVGSHTLQVTYVPTASGRVVAPAAPTVITLQVKKAKAKLGKVKVTKGKRNAKTIKRGSKATVRVVVKKVGAAAPTGKVTIRVGKKKVGTAKIKQTGKKYIATVKTKKKVTNKGKVKVVYSGNKTLKKATYKTKLRAR